MTVTSSETPAELQGWTLPLSRRGDRSTVTSPPWHYAGELIAVEFQTNVESVLAHLPAGFEPVVDGMCTAVACDWSSAADGDPNLKDDPAAGQYHEAFIVIHGTFAGKPAGRVSHIWVDNDVALVRGLIQGFPKQLGNIAMTRHRRVGQAGGRVSNQDSFTAHVARNGQQQLSLRVNDSTPSNDFPFGLALPQIHNRRFPSIVADGQGVDELVTVTTAKIEIANTQKGSGSITFCKELEEFQPTNVTGGYLLDVAFTVTGATLADSTS
jgi:Acetoacetate decarboxylase (ADC)